MRKAPRTMRSSLLRAAVSCAFGAIVVAVAFESAVGGDTSGTGAADQLMPSRQCEDTALRKELERIVADDPQAKEAQQASPTSISRRRHRADASSETVAKGAIAGSSTECRVPITLASPRFWLAPIVEQRASPARAPSWAATRS